MFFRKLLESAVSNAVAAVPDDKNIQPRWLGVENISDPMENEIMIVTNARVPPLHNVNATSSGEHTSGESLIILAVEFSSFGGVSHGVERTDEVEDSDGGAEDVTTESLGLEDGKEGGRAKMDSPRAR